MCVHNNWIFTATCWMFLVYSDPKPKHQANSPAVVIYDVMSMQQCLSTPSCVEISLLRSPTTVHAFT